MEKVLDFGLTFTLFLLWIVIKASGHQRNSFSVKNYGSITKLEYQNSIYTVNCIQLHISVVRSS